MKGGGPNRLGLWGEQQAARYLEAKGYAIRSARFRCREGEVDLIAQQGGYLCFVEVKLRKNRTMGEAREFVTRSKQRKIRQAASYYLMECPSGLQPRFDVVEVYAPQGEQTRRPEIIHWENAF